MNVKMIPVFATGLIAASALLPVAAFAATFSGEAAALKANALGVTLSLSDTGALPDSGDNLSTSLAAWSRPTP